MKKEILKLTGLTEDEFYRMYPTEEAFTNVYPGYKMKMGGLPEAFPQIATADNFFSYGVPVPPTYYAYGGPTYPQIQTEAQFFSPVYSNSNNAYAVGGSYMEAYPQAKLYPQGPVGGSAFYAMQNGGAPMQEPAKDQTFYTQKMNDFFDKLRQNSYKNMMNAIMNTEDQYSDDMKQLSMGQFGGRQPLNFYIPNNQTSWRNIREQRGKGLGDLTPEQLDAIKTGAANVADISYETRRAIFPKNRVSKVNVKFKNQPGNQEFKGAPNLMPGQKGFDPTVPGQPATTTTPAPVQNQQTAPAPGTQGMSPYGPYMNEYLFGPDNAPSVNAQVAAQQAANRTASSSPTNFTQEPPKDVELNDFGKALWVTADEAKAKGYAQHPDGTWFKVAESATPSFENLSGEIEMPADEVLKNMSSNPRVSQAPSNTNSMDPNVAKKKAGMKNPNTYINQDYINEIKNQAKGAKGLPPTNTTVPANTMDPNSWPGNMMPANTPKYDGTGNLDFRMGGPYVLPMYQGMTGPSQTGFQAPWQKTLDMVNPENYMLNAEGKSQYVDPSAQAEPADQGEFELGYDVSRVKNFDEYFPAKVQMAADIIGKIGQNRADKNFMRRMMKPDQWANTMDQFRGDYAMNQPAGANFRPDQMVPVSQYGGMMMYDVADLFFLTPQMLKKTKGKK
jgi:hypothetical protein